MVGVAPQPRILEIGPLNRPAHTGKNVDYLDVCEPSFNHAGLFIQAEWGGGLDGGAYNYLPIRTETYDLVFASHVLEHISWERSLNAIEEVYRILKPGGEFEVWVPNFAYIVKCYLKQSPGDEWRRGNPEDNFMKWVNGRIFTYGPEPNWHKACFDPPYLSGLLRKAGFKDVEELPARGKAGHGPVEFGLKARTRS